MNNISDQIDETIDAITDALNASYDYMPTNLQGPPPSAQEAADQSYWDAVGKGEGEGRSQPRNIRRR